MFRRRLVCALHLNRKRLHGVLFCHDL
jgi:hypothetical protein